MTLRLRGSTASNRARAWSALNRASSSASSVSRVRSDASFPRSSTAWSAASTPRGWTARRTAAATASSTSAAPKEMQVVPSICARLPWQR